MLERYPTDVPVLNNLALVLRDVRQFTEAASLWNKAIALDSSINVLYHGLLNARVGENKLDEARTAYQAAIEKTDLRNPGRQLMQIKLDAIGGAPAAKAV